jgi:hypothetical protein
MEPAVASGPDPRMFSRHSERGISNGTELHTKEER